MSKIVEAVRGYTNFQEEGRVKPGDRFAVEKTVVGLKTITTGRCKALVQSGLVRDWDPSGKAPPVSQAPTPSYAGNANAHITQPIKTAVRSAEAAKREAAPPEPRPLDNPAGGKTGAKPSVSSSGAAPQSSNVTSPARGKRKSASLPSTTPTKSYPGPRSFTPSMPLGGASTAKAPKGSKA